MIRYIECNIYPNFYWVEVARNIQDTIHFTYPYYLLIPTIDQNTAYYLVYDFKPTNHLNTPCLRAPAEFPWCGGAYLPARRYIERLMARPFPKPSVVKKRADPSPSPIPAMLTKLAPKIATTYLKKLSGEK